MAWISRNHGVHPVPPSQLSLGDSLCEIRSIDMISTLQLLLFGGKSGKFQSACSRLREMGNVDCILMIF